MVGAIAACRICRRLVCEACGADWTTCDQPVGRIVRLGWFARLRAVDPAGQLGVVSWRRGKLRLIDLRRLAWVDGPELPRVLFADGKVHLAANARLLYERYTLEHQLTGTGSLSLLDDTPSTLDSDASSVL